MTDPNELLKQLASFREPLVERLNDSCDLLVERLLKSSLPLTLKAEKRRTANDLPFYVGGGGGHLIYALDGISDELRLVYEKSSRTRRLYSIRSRRAVRRRTLDWLKRA